MDSRRDPDHPSTKLGKVNHWDEAPRDGLFAEMLSELKFNLGEDAVTATDNIDAMERQLDDTPADWDLRRVIADCYEEAGQDDWAKYYRWTAEHRKAPVFGEKATSNDTEDHWDWWFAPDGKHASHSILGVKELIRILNGRDKIRSAVEASLKETLEDRDYDVTRCDIPKTEDTP